MNPSTPEQIELVEAQIAALRMEEAALDRRRCALLNELADLVARLPKGVKTQWYAHGGYQTLSRK